MPSLTRHTVCPSNRRGCLICNADQVCLKCVHYITADDRQCVLECPRGYLEKWSNGPTTEPYGRVCVPNVTDPMLATIVVLTVIACACLMLLILGVVMIKRKQRQKFVRSALIDETIERDDFLKQLDTLRPNAEYFLAMLNDTRRQIRKLFLAGDHAGANSYRTIVRDLAKVLILLNRPVELIAKPPHDWPRVYSWALRIIDRYKPQIVQLIDFLQTPASQLNDPRLGSSQYSTFKSTDTSSTTCIAAAVADLVGGGTTKDLHQMQLIGSLISLHEIDNEPRSSASTNPFRNSCGTLKSVQHGGSSHQQQYPSSDIHGSSMWLEDEFFKLGFRPQDEITTEL